MEMAQIQIVPVDNGFFIQVVNADGSGQLNPRRVANDREQLVEEVKKLAEGLYTKEPPKPQTQGLIVPPGAAPPDETPEAGTAPKV